MGHASVVMVRCPTTGRELSTGVEMDPSTFERLPDIRSMIKCPVQSGSQLVYARSLAGESRPVHSSSPMVVHKQFKCGKTTRGQSASDAPFFTFSCRRVPF